MKAKATLPNNGINLPITERIACDEKTIDTLWWKWIVNENQNSIRADNGDDTIFEFIEPVTIEI